MWLIRVIIVLGILWFIAAIIGWMIRRALLKAIKRAQKGAQPQDTQKQLVPCKVCKTYIDKAEALEHHGHYFCSKEHLHQQKD